MTFFHLDDFLVHFLVLFAYLHFCAFVWLCFCTFSDFCALWCLAFFLCFLCVKNLIIKKKKKVQNCLNNLIYITTPRWHQSRKRNRSVLPRLRRIKKIFKVILQRQPVKQRKNLKTRNRRANY